jgi:thiamine transport system permease protein
VALAFVGAPVAATIVAGLDADLLGLAREGVVRRATATSIGLAVLSALLAVALSLSLAAARRGLSGAPSVGARTIESVAGTGAGLVLVVPPIVIGAGWFVLLRQTEMLFSAAAVMVVTVNAVMAMPFATRAIRPAYDAAGERNDRLCAQLGISGWNRAKLIDWPILRRPIATGFAFAMALSLGDLGVIALFGSDSVQTLPYLLLARLGSYRTDDAAGLALMLGLLCLVLVMVADRLAGTEAA